MRGWYFSNTSVRARRDSAGSWMTRRSRGRSCRRRAPSPRAAARRFRTQSERSPPPASMKRVSPSAANQISISCGAPVTRPGWSDSRSPPRHLRDRTYVRYRHWVVAYAELHCHTNFSFLDGASHPEELAVEAARLGLAALAVTDHDGFYGAVRFALAAREHGLPTVFGTELTLGIERPAERDPRSRGRAPRGPRRGAGRVRPARPGDQRGAVRGGEGRAPHHDPRARRRRPRRRCTSIPLASAANNSWFVLTGCRKGTVPAALVARRPCRRARARSTSSSPRSVAIVCSWSCGTTAIRSTVTATTSWRWLPRPPGRRDRHQQRPLRHSRAAPARHRARRGPRAAARSTRSTAGSPRRRSRTCAARASRRAASIAGRARWSAPSTSRARARSTCTSPRPSFPITTFHPGTPR